MSKKPPSINFPVSISLKLDVETSVALNKISLYEKQKRAVLIRNILIDKVKVYDHNPAFKRFVKDLADHDAQMYMKKGDASDST